MDSVGIGFHRVALKGSSKTDVFPLDRIAAIIVSAGIAGRNRPEWTGILSTYRRQWVGWPGSSHFTRSKVGYFSGKNLAKTDAGLGNPERHTWFPEERLES